MTSIPLSGWVPNVRNVLISCLCLVISLGFLNDVTDVEDLNLDGHDDEVEITFSSSSEWRGHP